MSVDTEVSPAGRANGSWPTARSDLRLGLRLAWGRSNRLRFIMFALGVALCTLVILSIAAISPTLNARSQRLDRVSPAGGPLSESTFRTSITDFNWRGHHIHAIGVAPLSSAAPVPPGVARFPSVGQVFASPALTDALRADPNDLAPLVPGTVVGVIDPAALPTPGDWVFYIGQDPNSIPADFGSSSWGAPSWDRIPLWQTDPVLSVVLLAGSVILIAPMIVFLLLAARIGGPARDRRSASLRLIGASAGQLRRYALAESLGASSFGFFVGVGMFVGARAIVPAVLGTGLTSGDIRVAPVVLVVTGLAVVLIATLAAAFSNRKVIIEPLSVTRRAPHRPHALWRLALCLGAAGVAVYVWRESAGPTAAGATAAGCLLLCIPVLLPLLIDRFAGLIRVGGPSTRLAVGRIRQDPLTSGRTASGISIAIAGAIAMVALIGTSFGGPAKAVDPAKAGDPDWQSGSVPANSPTDFSTFTDALRSVPGVETALAFEQFDLTDAAGNYLSTVYVADCATLQSWAEIGSCHAGSAFAVGSPAKPPAGGFRALAGATNDIWTPPLGLITVRPAPTAKNPFSSPGPSYLLTPLAATGLPVMTSMISVQADIPARSLDATEQALGRAAGFRGLLALQQQSASPTPADSELPMLRLGLIVASMLTLLLCALSQLVTGTEQLTDRRTALALARAQGVPFRTLAGSILGVALVPTVLGAALAVVIGTAVSKLVLHFWRDLPGSTWWTTSLMAVGAVVFVLLVALGTLIRLRKLTGAEALRTE